ncbi:MAG: M1 family metallopeptidase [Chitinophagales bacterium]
MQLKRFIAGMLLINCLFAHGQMNESEPEKIENFINIFYKSSAKRTIDITHTRLELTPFFDQKSLNGKALLSIKPYNLPIDRIALDAQGMKIKQVSIIEESDSIEVSYKYNDDLHLIVDLNRIYNIDEQFTLFIEYSAHPYTLEEKGIDQSYGRGLYFIDPLDKNPLKPTQLWTTGETQANSIWFPTVDAPNESFTQEIFITVDEKYTTLSNGILESTVYNNDGTKTDHWQQNQPHAPYLAMLAVGDYHVTSDDWGPIKVSYYTTPEYGKDARYIFGRTPSMLSYFSNLFHVDFPWDKYAQVVVYDYTSGAMENTSASTFYPKYYADRYDALDHNFDDIIAHELVHQWFGDLVTAESWAQLTLNEAFATYGEHLWYKYQYGQEEADYLQYSYLNSYLHEAIYKVEPIVNYYYEDADNDLFDSHRYEKGSQVLHMLRNYLGDDFFYKGLEYYLKTNRHQSVEIADLRMALEKVSGEDLYWFFDQWFMKPAHPIVDIHYRYDDTKKEITVSIDQIQTYDGAPIFKIPMNIDIYTNDTIERKAVWLKKKTESFTFPSNEAPNLVNVDADKVILWEKNDYKSKDQWVFQYNHAPLYVDRFEALEALASEQVYSEVYKTFKIALKDKSWHIRKYAIEHILLEKNGFNEILIHDLKKLALSDVNSHVRNAAVKKLADFDVRTAQPICDSLLNNDSSRLVIGTTLKILYSTNKSKYFKLAQQFEYIENPSVALVLANIYKEMGGSEQHAFFKKCLWTTRNSYATAYVRSYVDYLKRMDLNTLKDAVAVLSDLVEYEEDELVVVASKNGLYDLRSFFANNTLPNSEAKTAILNKTIARLEKIN